MADDDSFVKSNASAGSDDTSTLGDSNSQTKSAPSYTGSGPMPGQTFNGKVDTKLEKWQAARFRTGMGEMAVVESDTSIKDGVLLGPNGNPFTGVVAGETGTTRYEDGEVVLINGQPDFAEYGEGPNDNTGMENIGNGQMVSSALLAGKGSESGGLNKGDVPGGKGTEAGGFSKTGDNASAKTLPYGNPFDQTSEEGRANANAYMGFIQDQIQKYNNRNDPEWVRKIRGEVHDNQGANSILSQETMQHPIKNVIHNPTPPDNPNLTQEEKDQQAYFGFIKDKIDNYNDRTTPDWVKKIRGDMRDDSPSSSIQAQETTQHPLRQVGQSAPVENRNISNKIGNTPAGLDNENPAPLLSSPNIPYNYPIDYNPSQNQPLSDAPSLTAEELRNQVRRPVPSIKDGMSYKGGGNPYFDLQYNQGQEVEQANWRASDPVLRETQNLGTPSVDLSQQITEHVQSSANDSNVTNLTSRYLNNNIGHAAGSITQTSNTDGTLAFPPNSQTNNNQPGHTQGLPLAS